MDLSVIIVVAISVIAFLFLFAGWCYGFRLFYLQREWIDEIVNKSIANGMGCSGAILAAIPRPVGVFLTPFFLAFAILFWICEKLFGDKN